MLAGEGAGQEGAAVHPLAVEHKLWRRDGNSRGRPQTFAAFSHLRFDDVIKLEVSIRVGDIE